MEIKKLIEQGNAMEIVRYMKKHNLTLEGGKIKHIDPKFVKKQQEFWDKRQLVKKINLNS